MTRFTRTNTPPGFYTYAYLRENGRPYYIGKGSGARAWDRHGGNKHQWSAPCDERILFLKWGLTESKAHDHEIYMIATFGNHYAEGGWLTLNFTDGGEGVIGYRYTEQERLAKTDVQLVAEMGFDLADWLQKPERLRKKIKRRYRDLGLEGEALLAEKRVVSNEGVEKQQKGFAATKGRKYGFTGEEWLALSASEKKRVQAKWAKGARDKKDLLRIVTNNCDEKKFKVAATKRARYADSLGMGLDEKRLYVSLDEFNDRLRFSRRFRAGKRGAQLFCGFAAA